MTNKNFYSFSNLTPITLSLTDLVEVNLNLLLLSRGQYCIRQLFDVENSISFNNYACDGTCCEDCIRKWCEDYKKRKEEIE